jgi:hypothetical protein
MESYSSYCNSPRAGAVPGLPSLINICLAYLILLERPISLLQLPLAIFDVYLSGGPGRGILEGV